MIGCGLDLSLNGTGICAIEFNSFKQLNIIYSNTIKQPNKKEDTSIKAIYVRDYIENLLANELRLVDFYVIEHYSYNGVGSLTKLAELSGMVKHLLFINKKPYYTFQVSKIRKNLLDKGNATKTEVADFIKNKYNFTFETQDESDAAALVLSVYETTIKDFI